MIAIFISFPLDPDSLYTVQRPLPRLESTVGNLGQSLCVISAPSMDSHGFPVIFPNAFTVTSSRGLLERRQPSYSPSNDNQCKHGQTRNVARAQNSKIINKKKKRSNAIALHANISTETRAPNGVSVRMLMFMSWT